MIKKTKFIRLLIHLTAIVTILLVPYLLDLRSLKDLEKLFLNPLAFRYFISFLLLIGFFYANYLFFIEKLYLKRKFILYTLWVFAALITILGLPEVIAATFHIDEPNIHGPTEMPPLPPNHKMPPQNGQFDQPFPPPPPPQYERAFEHGAPDRLPFNPKMNIIVFFFISVFLSISIQTDKRLQRIENEKLIAELAQLKAQINPHFLFNTLNSIYALAMRKDGKAGESILKLAELMRFILQDAQNSTVPLDNELTFINNYIALQRHRLTDYMALNYQVEGSTKGKRIAPLLLMTFIENAFKYGINPDEDCVIHIKISIFESDLVLNIVNKKVRLSPNQISSGIGLSNTEERLQLLYPSKHRLDITENADSYSVKLTITLT